MKTYDSSKIRNVVLAGHSSKGKSTVAEAMLYHAGATDRFGKIADGNTVMDSEAEEKKRKCSVSVAVAPVEWKDVKINLIDTPGLFDFAQGMNEGMRVADTALIVMSAKSGLSVGAEKAFKIAGKRGMARVFVTTKMDGEHADFNKTFNGLVSAYGSSVCPVIVPIKTGGKVAGYYNFVTSQAFSYNGGKAQEIATMSHDDEARFDALKAVFAEAVAGADEELMEKYFEGEEFTYDEKVKGLREGVKDGTLFPIVACAGITLEAVDMLLDFVADILPAPKSEYGTDEKGEPVEVACDPDGALCAICFKTIADPFIGKLSFFKTVRGKISNDVAVYNTRKGASEKMGKIVTVRGGKQEDSIMIPAGDIGAVTKMAGVATGDTICSPNQKVVLNAVASTLPCYSMAVEAKKKGEEEKIAAGILKLCEEDPSLTLATNKETKQQILSGQGEQHLEVVMSKLSGKFGVDAVISVPEVAYREAITRSVKAQGRYKKQSGGHGQFGDVFIEFEPCDCDGLEFCERVVGGAVPKNYFPAVEKGLLDCIQKGMLAGFPMVGLRATLYDGSYHPVDSSEMSFKLAATMAYKKGISEAGPVILEPIGTLKAYVNEETMGDIIGDINKRRGRVLGMNSVDDGMQEVVAEVPSAEMTSFPTAIRQITQGRGSFEFEFVRYEKAPDHISQKIIDKYGKEITE